MRVVGNPMPSNASNGKCVYSHRQASCQNQPHFKVLHSAGSLHKPKSNKLLVCLCINKENDFVLFFISEKFKRAVKVSLLSLSSAGESSVKSGPTACYQ